MRKRVTMQDRVLDYMREFGSITPLDAVKDLGNYRLSGTLFCLKEKGYDIVSKMETVKNRWGSNSTFARYYLADSVVKSTDNKEGN